MEKILQIEENKLNQQLRTLTKLHHHILNTENDSFSQNQFQIIFDIFIQSMYISPIYDGL